MQTFPQENDIHSILKENLFRCQQLNLFKSLTLDRNFPVYLYWYLQADLPKKYSEKADSVEVS